MTDPSPTLTFDAVSRRCGNIADWKVAAIEQSGGTLSDLDIALAWVTGESDVMGKERRQLGGAADRIYDILTAEEESWDEPA